MTVNYASYSPVLKWALRVMDQVLGKLVRPRLSEQPAAETIRRILVSNQAHLGDAILATSVMPALRQHFPNATFGVLVHPASAQVFEGFAGVQWIHTVEHWHLNRRGEGRLAALMRHHRSRRRVLREIRALHYQLAIDLHPYFPNSIALLHRAGIDHLVGWSSAGWGAYLNRAAHDDGHIIGMLDRHRRLLRLLQVPEEVLTRLSPTLGISAAAASAWSRTQREHAVPADAVAVHVGAHAAHRRWPATLWAQLVVELSRQGQVVVLLGHGEAEAALCRSIKQACPQAIDLSNRLSWPELVAAIGDSRLLISHDSAATHIGAALHRPRICIAAGIHDPTVWLQHSSQSRVLMKAVPCSPCGLSRGCAHMSCLRGVSPHSVAETAQQLLGATAPPRVA
jgi:ADP-heptose:LPS heptosyltransferase